MHMIQMHAIYDTRMPIHHVTYAMPNARNAQRKAIHMLQRRSHTPTQEIKQTPSSPRKLVKVAWSRGFGENIGYLVMCGYMDQRYRPFLYVHYLKTSNRSRNICNGPLTAVTSTHVCNSCCLAPITYKRARTTPGLAFTTPVTNVDFW
jgi:hypothetical protein